MERGDDDFDASAPWERPALWDPATPPPAEPIAGGRRHRYADDEDDTTVLASDLIAALRDEPPVPQTEPDADPTAGPEPAAEPDADPAAEPEPGPATISHEVYEQAPGTAEPLGRGWRRTGRALVAALAVMLLLVAGTEWVIKARADAVLADNEISALDTADTNISSSPAALATLTSAAAPADAAPHHYEAENILLLGSDSRASHADAALGGKNDDPGGSDVVMVAHLSADRSHVTVISIPRDTYVNAPTCKAWDYQTNQQLDRDYTSSYSVWRINSTYAAGGPPCTVKAVQEMTGLRIDRVIIIDFAGFAAIVDAQGGIDVNACKPVIDGKLGAVLPVAGLQHIDGKQALNLVRARKVEGDTTSDIARIRRQQKVLSTILRQATSTGVLLNPIKLNNVLQAFVHNVKTDNVTLDNLLDIAQSLGNLDPRRVTFFTLPTYPDSNGVGLHPTAGSELIWQALRNDTPLPGEVTEPVTPTTTAPSTTPMTTITPDPVTSVVTQLVTTTPTVPQLISVAPQNVNLQVANVANRPGVANQARDALAPLGFRIADPDLLRVEGVTESGISVVYSPEGRAAALTVAASVPGASLVEKSGLGTKVQLRLGTSFNPATFTVRTVAAGQPLPSALSTPAGPVTRTVTSTVVSTPPPIVLPVTPTTTAPKTTSPTLASSDVTSVNAGTAGCI